MLILHGTTNGDKIFRKTGLIMKIMETYQSPQNQWERSSAIRTRPRRLLEEKEEGYYFPPLKQPIILHPLLKNIDEEQKRYILTQSLFKYMNDIANIEKDIINKAAYGITKNYYGCNFSNEIKRDALTIIIDETYHAYVAIDYMYQVAEFEKIQMLPLPDDTELSNAIKNLSHDLEDRHRRIFELIAVCIAEHALTYDLIDVAKTKEVCKTFYYVMHDHVLDETRHAKYFQKILEIYWQFIDDEDKKIIIPLIPKLISLYMAPNLQKSFDRSILESLKYDSNTIDLIISETHYGWREDVIDVNNIIVKQMIKLLENARLLEDSFMVKAFLDFGVVLK